MALGDGSQRTRPRWPCLTPRPKCQIPTTAGTVDLLEVREQVRSAAEAWLDSGLLGPTRRRQKTSRGYGREVQLGLSLASKGMGRHRPNGPMCAWSRLGQPWFQCSDHLVLFTQTEVQPNRVTYR